MIFTVFATFLRHIAAVFLVFTVVPFWTSSASAATFQVDFSGGAATVFGTFNAPIAGGNVTNFSVTLSGVTFDTSTGAATSFTYNPAVNDFGYTGAFPSFTNSANNPLCAIGACFLEIYPNPGSPIPGDYLAIDSNLNNIDAGTKYIINPVPIVAPVPIPATLPLVVLGLLVMVFVGRNLRPNAQPRVA